MKRIFLILGAIFWMNSFALAGGEAMFGLEWGMSPYEIRNQGTRLVLKNRVKNLSIYSVKVLPKNLKDADYYRLVFGNTDQLVKIIMVGKKIRGDFYGEQGKNRFAEIAHELAQKYEEVKSITEVGIRVYDAPNEFYQCLAHSGCGIWVKTFKADNKVITIQLNGVKAGEGYIDIRVEAYPEWDEITGRKMPVKSVEDAEAL